jgi:hypothetical protein
MRGSRCGRARRGRTNSLALRFNAHYLASSGCARSTPRRIKFHPTRCRSPESVGGRAHPSFHQNTGAAAHDGLGDRVGLWRLSRSIAGANPCNLCRLNILFAMVRPFLVRRGMVSMPPFLLLSSQALLVGGPADFAALESMQSQRSQLLLQTLTRSHAWDFNRDRGLLVNFPRRLWCFPIEGCCCVEGGQRGRVLADSFSPTRAPRASSGDGETCNA